MFEHQKKIADAPEINHGRFFSDFSTPVTRRTEKIEWDSDRPGLGQRFRGQGDGTWVVQWRRAGRSFRRALGPAKKISRDAAWTLARRVMALDAEVLPVTKPAVPAPTVAEFAESFHRDCAGRWKPTTRATVGHILRRQLVPTFGHRPINAVTRAEVVLWFESTPASANWGLSVLSSLMIHAELLGLRPDNSNPCAGLRRKKSGFSARYPTAEDYQRIGQAMRGGSSTFRRSARIIRFLSYTGARRGEAMAIRWEHFHGDRFVLPDSKTGPKTLWLPRAARSLLKRTRRRTTNPYVFGVSNRPRALRELSMTWKEIRETSGLPDMRLHDLRHGFASVAVTHGIELRVVAGLLGHADLTTTLGYAHLAQSEVAAAAERVSGRLASAIGSPDAPPVPKVTERIERPRRLASSPVRMNREAADFYLECGIDPEDPDNPESPRAFCDRRKLDFEAFKVALRRHRSKNASRRTVGGS